MDSKLTLAKGTVLKGGAGTYRILRRLRAGPTAELYLGCTVGLEGFRRQLAIKRLLPEHAGDRKIISDFLAEARTASRLRHPNIIRVIDVGMHDSEYFMTMEYLEGVNLQQLLKHCKLVSSALPVSLSCALVARLCDALSYAHNGLDDFGTPMRIIHRNLSPAKLVLGHEGELKLIDFGQRESSSASLNMSEANHSIDYFAPERLNGKEADHRSDVFSAGVLLWELLTGRRLFPGPYYGAAQQLLRSRRAEPPSAYNRKVSPALDKVVARALAPRPRRRYQDSSHFQDALENAVGVEARLWSSRKISQWVRKFAGGEAGDFGNAFSVDDNGARSRHRRAPISKVTVSLRPCRLTSSGSGTDGTLGNTERPTRSLRAAPLADDPTEFSGMVTLVHDSADPSRVVPIVGDAVDLWNAIDMHEEATPGIDRALHEAPTDILRRVAIVGRATSEITDVSSIAAVPNLIRRKNDDLSSATRAGSGAGGAGSKRRSRADNDRSGASIPPAIRTGRQPSVGDGTRPRQRVLNGNIVRHRTSQVPPEWREVEKSAKPVRADRDPVTRWQEPDSSAIYLNYELRKPR